MDHVKSVNAVFDELWAEAQSTIEATPFMFRSTVEAALTRDKVLATAEKVVAAIEKANK